MTNDVTLMEEKDMFNDHTSKDPMYNNLQWGHGFEDVIFAFYP